MRRCSNPTLSVRENSMKVLVLVKATEAYEEGYSPEPWMSEMMAAMGRFNDELKAAGVLVMAEGLEPSSAGKRVTFDGPGREVTDGPFALTRDLVAGFWIWEVANMEEAVAWAKRIPNPMLGPSDIEIRPIAS